MSQYELPEWWIKYVALERLECRKFFTDNNWIEYDLDLKNSSLMEEDLIQSNLDRIKDAKALITGPDLVFDNVDPISVAPRMVRGMVGSYFEPLNEDVIKPEGCLSEKSFPQKINPIKNSDPCTSLSEMIYVKHKDRIYQWKVAELKKGSFAGQKGKFPFKKERSFYISKDFPQLYYDAQRKHAEIHHIRVKLDCNK